MSRILVANDARTVYAEVRIDDTDGYTTADCESCPWTTEPDRHNDIRNAIEEARIHLDLSHR